MSSYSRVFSTAPLLAGSIALLLGGCAALPSSGPTAHQIVRRSKAANADFRFQIVNLDAAAVAALNQADAARRSTEQTLNSLAQAPNAQVIGPGDVLTISLYEVGVSLFQTQARDTGGTFDPSAHGEKFPSITVSESGEINLPYVGTLTVAGLTSAEIERRIDQRLAGKSQEPRAIVTIGTNVFNTAYVYGDVRKPGRFELAPGGEHILDAVALAGGASYSSEDTVLRFERGKKSLDQRLNTILADGPDDLPLIPGDHIELIKRPRTYTVFGATTKVSQVSFETGEVSLAEAMARVSGPNDSQADASAVFLFRYDGELEKAAGERPIIYRLNMLDPASYFIAQRFKMRDKDVIYVANASANQPSKFLGVINQLFAPFVTVRAATH